MDSEIGNMVRIQGDQYQQILGTQENLLELDITKYPYNKESRTKVVWNWNTKNGVHIKLKDAWKQDIRRENDTFIMDKTC